MAGSAGGQPIDHLTTHVINLVRRGVAVTRPELIRQTGLGRTVVNERVDQAIREGLLVNEDVGRSTGGRPSRLLRFRREVGTIHAIEIDTSHLSVAVTDLDGRPLAVSTVAWDLQRPPAETLERAEAVLTELAGGRQPWAVGVALPGPVDFTAARSADGGILLPGWDRFDIRGWYSARTAPPVWVDNDLNILVYRQWERSGERNPETPDRNLILVKVSVGVGAGALSNGRVHRGLHGSAGAIGHTAIKSDRTVVCRCGQTNCLEAHAGGWALVRDATAAVRDGASSFLAQRLAERGEITVRDIADGAIRADPLCFELVQYSSTLVGEAIATLVSFFDPGVVYVGGILPDVGDLYLTTVRRTVLNNAYPVATKNLQILHTGLEQDDVVLGAARMAITHLFDPGQEFLWLQQVARSTS